MAQATAPAETPVYQDEKEHGSALFPFNIYPCAIPDYFEGVPLHWQNSMELIYVRARRACPGFPQRAGSAGGGYFCTASRDTARLAAVPREADGI